MDFNPAFFYPAFQALYEHLVASGLYYVHAPEMEAIEIQAYSKTQNLFRRRVQAAIASHLARSQTR